MTYQQWKQQHQEEIAKAIAAATNDALQHLYKVFSDEVYRDGYNDGVEETEERLLGEREEEL